MEGKMTTKKSTFLSNSLMNLVSNLITIAISLGTSVIIARGLGVEGQGLYAIITLLPTLLVTFLNLGIGPATVYYIGKEKYTRNQIIGTNMYLSAIISVISLLLAVVLINVFKESYFKEIAFSDLWLILISIPFLFFNTFIQSIYQGLQNFKKYNLINIYNKIIQLMYLVVLVLIGQFYLTSVLISFIIASIIPSLMLIYDIYKDKDQETKLLVSNALVKDMFSYGWKAHLSNVVSFLNYRADLIMLTLLSSTYSVGIYNVAVLIAEKLWVFSQPISTALFPRIVSLKDVHEKNNLTAFTMKTVLYFSALFAMVFALLCYYLIVIMFGKEYEQATQPVLILLVGITVFAAERILSNDLAGRGKPEYNLYTTMFTVTCNIVLNFIFIPKFGFNGAALSTSIAYCLTFLVKLVVFTKYTGVPVKTLLVLTKADLKTYKSYLMKVVKRAR